MIESKTPLPASQWVYAGKGKDGKPKLKRLTYESAEEVADILNSHDLPFEFSKSAHMFKIFNPYNYKLYQYFYTTGKWGVYYFNKRPDKHYHSNGIVDFINKYLLKGKK